MRKIALGGLCFPLILIVLLTQCKGKTINKESSFSSIPEEYSYSGLYARIQAVFDSYSDNAIALKEAIIPYLDTLKNMSEDRFNLKSRLAAQSIIYYVVDNLYDISEDENDLELKDVDAMTAPLLEAIGKWFYDVEDGIPVLWHDMYYLSDKESDDPVNGYFHIMVLLPTADRSEAELHVFYPDCAESTPSMAFTSFLGSDTINEDWNSLVTVPFENWYKRDELEEGYPLYGKAGKDIIEKMLTYNVMYLSFSRSQVPEIGDHYETARLSLSYFKQKYQEYKQNK